MSRRRLSGLAGILLVWLPAIGCGTGQTPVAAPPAVTPVQIARPEPAAAKDAEPSSPAAGPKAAGHPGPMRITPREFTITADDPGLQLLVTREDDGTSVDLTGVVRWTVTPPELATIEAGGYLRPLGEGKASISAELEGTRAASEGRIEPRHDRPWDFAQDVVPILTRLGCNTGSCHGKADGQNGFHLSLMGYDPEGDYRQVVRDWGQRRITPLDPSQSLFLGKSTGRIPHGGGPRLAANSAEYRTLLEWIRAGAPERRGKSHGALVDVSIEPAAAMLKEPGPQQLRVVAKYADGHLRDVTRQSLFKVNDDSSASVDPQGRGALLRRAEADVIVRYQSHVLSARLGTIVNPDLRFDFASLPRRNVIDEELLKRLASLAVPPSPPARDAAFLRRASLDLTGEQPTPAEIRQFLADKDPEKRPRLIDKLMARPEFVLFWRIKLGDLLQISTARQGNTAYRYHDWVDRCLTKNTPWDVMVRRLLTAVGDPNDIENGGPVNYALDPMEPTEAAEQTAQRFLGIRMRCAQCHDHPFDVWTQDDYYGLAAFFAKVQRGGGMGGMMASKALITVNPRGEVKHLRTGRVVPPRPPGGKAVTVAEKDDPRQALAAWMTSADNPFFARATVNWAWAQLFGKGLVDPPDDMSRSNPPVHPELLDALARHFVARKYDLRALIRTIATSEAYGLASATVPGNEKDTRLFSHHTPRPLTAHQMADALAQATDVPNTFGALGARLAIKINDPSTPSPILDTFGRCSRAATCSPVESAPLSLKQSLFLIGGDLIESKVSNLNGYLASALKLELESEELIENLYLRTVCRPPSPEESSRWSAELKQATSLREAAEDLFWSLLNSREFAFNH
jgi:hypothetical protein